MATVATRGTLRALWVVIAAALYAAPARAAEAPIPPSPSTWVTDNARALRPATRDALDTRLSSYNRETGHQVIVWIGTTTGDTPLEDWTIRAFTAWKVGRKGLDDGLALFIFMQDHKIRIEVGYGLEGTVTDAAASSIIRNNIAPQMKAGDPDAAVTAGVSALLAAVGGEHGAAPQPPPSGKEPSVPGLFWILIFILIVWLWIPILVRRRFYTIGSGPIIFGSSGGWGGFSGGGSSGGGFGGFSGGGGMGGGGGASGGW